MQVFDKGDLERCGEEGKDGFTMKLFGRQSKIFAGIVGLILFTVLFTACGSANTGSSGGGGSTSNGNGGALVMPMAVKGVRRLECCCRRRLLQLVGIVKISPY